MTIFFENRRAPDASWAPFRLTDAFLPGDALRESPSRPRGASFAPPFEVKETPDAYVIKADVPGLTESDLELTVLANTVTISGRRAPERAAEEHRYHVVERAHGAFTRTFGLPKGASVGEVSADLRNGVLSLHIPKRKEAQPRKIQIGHGAGATSNP